MHALYLETVFKNIMSFLIFFLIVKSCIFYHLMNSKQTIDEYLILKILAYIHIYFLFKNKTDNYLDFNLRNPLNRV